MLYTYLVVQQEKDREVLQLVTLDITLRLETLKAIQMLGVLLLVVVELLLL
jgi:hypothetical protein